MDRTLGIRRPKVQGKTSRTDAPQPETPRDFESKSRSRRPEPALLVVLAVLVLVIAYISLSDGIDYIHGFGRACLVFHDGWHFHANCGSVSPPQGG
jgi:hypothetical protein